MTVLKGNLSKYVDKIEAEIMIWENYRNIEDSPITGGNVVKAAHYGGTMAGLKIALAMLTEVFDEV